MSRSVLDSLNAGLLKALAADEHVLLLGEDILDPYGGAFKVTKGCSEKYPQRVVTTPISEAGLAGVATGLALRGYRPVVEVMFGDFITLMADQLVNHIAKFRWMYNDTVRLPLVIRTPMGGRRGYGPTHSQTLEKLFLGIPGLTVIAPNHLLARGSAEPGELLAKLILETQDPVVFIENKAQYLLQLQTDAQLQDFVVEEVYESTDQQQRFPVRTVEVKGAPHPACTIAAYGYMSELCLQAMHKLAFEHEQFCRLVIPTKLSPFDVGTLAESTARTGYLVTVEEGTRTSGWGAEVATRCAEQLGAKLKGVRRVAAKDTPVPAALTLETGTLPQVDNIVDAVRKLAGKNG